VTERLRKPKAAEPTPELPESGADLEPQSQPLSHHEPADTHGHDHEPAVGDIPAERHNSGDHDGGRIDEHGGGHGHHAEERVGPIDWTAWGYTALGVAVALVVVAAFWLAAY
jgi:hypothetical protein